MHAMLEKFRRAKQREIQALQALEDKGQLPEPWEGFRPSFGHALRRGKAPAVIAEYKRASPSRGVINLDLTPEDVAAQYALAGASCLSVLTEEDHFQGELGFLERMHPAGLPLLRKDFLLDPLQVAQTAATPAAALLLIVRMLSVQELAALHHATTDAGLEAVVEIFDEQDLEAARAAGARLIQVNNRDLDTLKTDLAISARLVQEKDPAEVWISASGITTPHDLSLVRDLGFEAALIGTFLMEEGAPGRALAMLRKEL
jgi:indole-3-glycerol phosphate synthase